MIGSSTERRGCSEEKDRGVGEAYKLAGWPRDICGINTPFTLTRTSNDRSQQRGPHPISDLPSRGGGGRGRGERKKFEGRVLRCTPILKTYLKSLSGRERRKTTGLKSKDWGGLNTLGELPLNFWSWGGP